MASNETAKFWQDPALYEVAARAIAVAALLVPAEGAAVRWLAFSSIQMPNAPSVAVSATLVDLTAIGVLSVLAGTFFLVFMVGIQFSVGRGRWTTYWREQTAASVAFDEARARLFQARGRRVVSPRASPADVDAERDPELAAIARDVQAARDELSRLRRAFELSLRRDQELEDQPRYIRWRPQISTVAAIGAGLLWTLLFPIDSTLGPQFLAVGVVVWVIPPIRRDEESERHLGMREALPITIAIIAIVIVPAGLGYQPPLAKVDLATATNVPDGNYLILGERDGSLLLGSCTPERDVVTVHTSDVVSTVFLPRTRPKLPSYLDILRGAPLTTAMSLACEIAPSP